MVVVVVVEVVVVRGSYQRRGSVLAKVGYEMINWGKIISLVSV